MRDSGLASSGSGVNDVVNYDDWYGTCMATDAAVSPVNVFTPKCVYPGADPVNGTGGNIIVSGSPGERTITGCTRAGVAGDTIVFVVQLNTGASSTVTLTEGVSWVCAAAASDIECICNLKAAVAGHATLGSIVTVNSTDATCSDEKLSFGVVPGTSWQLSVTPSDTTNMVRVNGTDGCLRAGNFYFCQLSTSLPSYLAVGISMGGTEANIYGATFKGTYMTVQGAGSMFRNYLDSTVDGTMGFLTDDAKGASSKCGLLKSQTLTFAAGGDASKVTTGGFIPLGAKMVEVTGRVIVADTSAVTLFDVGDGVDADLYANDVPADTLGQTFGPAVTSYGPTAQIPGTQLTAAGEVTVTAVGGSAEDLSVRLTAHYCIDTADTSN
jgi:hypothetical protein